MNPFDALGIWLGEVVQWALALVQTVGPVWSTVVAGIAILFECTIFLGLIVPGDTIVVAAATGVTSPLQFVVLLVTVIVSTLVGQSLGFLLGRWAGPAIRRSALGRRLGNGWDRSATFVTRRGGWAVFMSRFLPVLHALMPVTVGMSGMPFRRFIVWAAPAATIWSVLYVGVGAAAAGSFRALEGRLHFAGYVFVAVLLAGIVLILIAKRLLGRAAAASADEEDPAGRMDGDEPAA